MKTIMEFQKIIISNKKIIALCSLLDLLFFLGFSWLAINSLFSIKENVEAVSKVMAENMDPTTEVTQQTLDMIQGQVPVIMNHYQEIMWAAGMFIGGMFLLWLILQGTNWYLAHKIAQSKVKPKTFAKAFTLTSLNALVAFSLIFVSSIKLASTLQAGPIPLITQDTINTISLIIFIFTLYLLAIALAMLPKKNWHKKFLAKAFKDPIHTVLPFAGIAAIIVLLNFLMMRSLQIHYLLFALFTFGLVLPSYTLSRVFWIKQIQEKIRFF